MQGTGHVRGRPLVSHAVCRRTRGKKKTTVVCFFRPFSIPKKKVCSRLISHLGNSLASSRLIRPKRVTFTSKMRPGLRFLSRGWQRRVCLPRDINDCGPFIRVSNGLRYPIFTKKTHYSVSIPALNYQSNQGPQLGFKGG